MSFRKYWFARVKESLVKARVRTEALVFVAFILFGLAGKFFPWLPVDKTIWWICFSVFGVLFFIEFCFISPFNHAQKLIRERDAAQAALAEIKALPPKKTVHVVIDRFNELIATGEVMKDRLCANEAPLPTTEEVKAWGNELINVAGSYASTHEIAKLRRSLHHGETEELLTALLHAPKENYDTIQEIVGKIIATRAIIQRIRREDAQ
jgi:vacuolar-type H+-ATPase subunit I/STV1